MTILLTFEATIAISSKLLTFDPLSTCCRLNASLVSVASLNCQENPDSQSSLPLSVHNHNWPTSSSGPFVAKSTPSKPGANGVLRSAGTDATALPNGTMMLLNMSARALATCLKLLET